MKSARKLRTGHVTTTCTYQPCVSSHLYSVATCFWSRILVIHMFSLIVNDLYYTATYLQRSCLQPFDWILKTSSSFQPFSYTSQLILFTDMPTTQIPNHRKQYLHHYMYFKIVSFIAIHYMSLLCTKCINKYPNKDTITEPDLNHSAHLLYYCVQVKIP